MSLFLITFLWFKHIILGIIGKNHAGYKIDRPANNSHDIKVHVHRDSRAE